MTDFEFISLFRIEELPECATGLFLLKQWLELDPEALVRLQSTGFLDTQAMSGELNAPLEAWLDHLAGCPECLLIHNRPKWRRKDATNSDPLTTDRSAWKSVERAGRSPDVAVHTAR